MRRTASEVNGAGRGGGPASAAALAAALAAGPCVTPERPWYAAAGRRFAATLCWAVLAGLALAGLLAGPLVWASGGAQAQSAAPGASSASGASGASSAPGADPLALLYDRDFAGLHALAAAELDSSGIGLERKLDLLRAEAAAHLATYFESRQSADREKAVAAMKAMLALDGQADFVPGYRFPEPVHALFREVRHEYVTTYEAVADPSRVAVAPFYLIDMGGSEKVNWAGFAEALPFIITDALQDVPGLILLSREHMRTIRAELSLASQSDLVSKENRLRLGELLSASSFVYGELQVLPGDEVYFEMRWVQTETGVTLLARQARKRIRDGGDLLELEESVLIDEFIPAMLAALDKEAGVSGMASSAGRVRDHFQRKMAIAGRGDTYLHYVATIASAMAAEEEGAYESALEQWRSAAELMPAYEAPRERVEALRLLSARVKDAGN